MSLLSFRTPAVPKRYTASAKMFAAIGHRYNAHELRLIERLGTVTTLPAGRRFVTEGAFGREAVIILDGSASIVHENSDGGVETIATVGKGDLVGEVALLSGQSRNATVMADTDLEIVVFNIREFRSLLDQAPRLSFEIEGRAADKVG